MAETFATRADTGGKSKPCQRSAFAIPIAAMRQHLGRGSSVSLRHFKPPADPRPLEAASASSEVVSSTTASSARRMFGASRVSRASISASTVAGSAAIPFASQLQPAATRTSGQGGGDVELHRRIGENHRADIAAVQHRTALGGEAALEIQQCRAHCWDRRHRGGGGVRHGAAQIGALQVGRPQRARSGLRSRRVRGIAAAIQHPPPDRTIQQAGVEIRQPERSGDAAAPACPSLPRRARRSQ